MLLKGDNDSINNLINIGMNKLSMSQIVNPRRDARILMSSALRKDIGYLISNPELIVNLNKKKIFLQYIERRANREPVSKIIGFKPFWKENFLVTQDVLDPRPDSEIVIESVLKHSKQISKKFDILDIGTGSGALILSLLNEFPLSKGLGTDKSIKAIEVAKMNSEKLNLQDRCKFLVMDWCKGLNHKFDIIISNPPYIPSREIKFLEPEVKFFDPKIALDGGTDGLVKIDEILLSMPYLLKKSGLAVLEIGYNQLNEVKEKILSNGLKIIEIFRDLSGIDRCIVVSLVGK